MSNQSHHFKVGNVIISAMSKPAALNLLVDHILAGKGGIFSFANAHSVNLARQMPAFADVLQDITIFNDGVGIDLAALILTGKSLPDNLNGTDLTPALLSVLPTGTRIFLLGSPPGVAVAAQVVLSRRFPLLQFVGARDGFFLTTEGDEVATQIAEAGAQLVIVGMGQPHQEFWATNYAKSTNAVALCAGAILDFTAGRFTRAPRWLQVARLEWAYRLILEPRRLMKRYLVGNASFLLHVFLERHRR